MPDYKNGKIYTIRCKLDSSLVYVGSTCEKLCSRFTKHKYDWKNNTQMPLYSYIEDFNDWYIELVEDFPCERREQLLKREGEIMREIGNLNKQIAGRTIEEYRKTNSEKTKQYNTIYYQENKEKIKNQCKEYMDAHREQKHKNDKQYREQNKEKIKLYFSIDCECECGCIVKKSNLTKHKNTKKHKDFMNNLQA